MKVFLSWSGAVSKQAAEAFRDWLPTVLQAVEPWMSAEDIQKGARWSTQVAAQLSETSAGVIFVTADNFLAPWLNFEAGALSKSLDRSFICPYLLGLGPTDLRGPLVQFQAAVANREDTRRLVNTLNAALDERTLSESKLEKTFEAWWPELETALDAIEKTEPKEETQRQDRDVLQEVLALVRELARELLGPSSQLPRRLGTIDELLDHLRAELKGHEHVSFDEAWEEALATERMESLERLMRGKAEQRQQKRRG